MKYLNARTAAPEASIWKALPEEDFRRHLVALEERTNAVPIDPQVFDVSSWSPTGSEKDYILPLAIEQQLADDFARLVAVDEGAQSVAAVCIEQNLTPPSLTLRFAALDAGKNEAIKSALEYVSSILKELSSGLVQDVEAARSKVLDQIVKLHFLRLLARLRSEKWSKPKYLSKSHKKPLWQDFTNLYHRAGHLYTRREKTQREAAEDSITSLSELYHGFETTTSEDEHDYMIKLIMQSYFIINTPPIQDLITRLDNSVGTVPTPQVASAIKCLRQVQKIAGYKRISDFLVTTAATYPQLFQHGLQLEYITPYASIPTSIGYESWAKTCHVHAEIQLVVYYDLISQAQQTVPHNDMLILPPRCIGISKWLCYLCYRFIEAHGKFFPSKTHGRLYDQWTVPDLVEFEEGLRCRYADVLRRVDEVVVGQTEAEAELWRVEPMTSVDAVHTEGCDGNDM